MRSLFRRNAADSELDTELRFHLERQIAVNVSAGMSQAQARRTAMREFGGVESLKEECRNERRVNWIQDLVQDLRYGLRMLRKSPASRYWLATSRHGGRCASIQWWRCGVNEDS